MIVHWFWIGKSKCTFIRGTASEFAGVLMKRGVSFVEVVELLSC